MLHRLKSFTLRAQGFVRRRYHRFKAYLAHRGLRHLVALLNVKHPSLEVRLLDIGARRGLEGRYHSLAGLNHFYVEGIEPDKQEAAAVMARGFYRKVHPVAVADQVGQKRLYITKVLGCTSLRKPNMENLKRYAISTWFEVQKEIDLEVTTLDALYPSGERFDFISMDVQGAEYEVIRGGERLFDQALGFSLEVHFVEIYEGQKLFSFMHDFWLGKGFRLIRLGHCEFDGETAEAECVYVKDHRQLTRKEDFLKCLLFALNWDNPAYAENLLRNAPAGTFSPEEEREILCAIGIKKKAKSDPWPDGFSAKTYGDGSGYL